ncbi:hypothetical protein COCC4DRAFT_199270 [Bipolaris maydis ATCC 48331]|uniref:Uncharacterized protein n=2 Tax=Cochliobolus heterostrophus TaxID=5016 RepID=M2TH82_COCH5|nr:uncharacterized protein COCC4DRAFT_199270 [Bipolaris maydis ATCC 48331]EMD96800.1 hypothetical protein COCHEDRAFT_1199648 [Bipolaris maydis C5]KAH7558234.1 hypothetical protein BM1_05506 [Bipolaris maydis]ENI03667.1 hypothetical protein COCC4DRAFT_199270 [Bipolaris maydis ATCC 48331]KAJ5031319.1 hypothetical protein J3E73DRAFT_377383 [Bipolaris maydis]KAJ5060630.1 hypothetical protein J3E74DRAFT_271739 [Bipolaris maydis]
MADVEEQYKLSQEQIDFFMENGWLKLSDCFTREQADKLQETLWTRLGMDPNDMSTWHTERTNMPFFHEFPASTFAPKAWAGICSLLGGSARVDSNASTWKDGFIVNLGTPAGHNSVVRPQDLPQWHVDGDFFVHYLDSPEQALLVIPLWTDIVPGGGGTYICPAAIPHVAKHLYENPDGVSPRMTPRAQNPDFIEEKGLSWFNNLAASMPDDAFVEATGVVGDVYLLHPLMLHAASNNQLRNVRVITNPPVSVKEPFVFDRPDGNYSVVERKTMKALGKERLEGFKITGPRQMVVPERVRIQEEMKKKEEERLRKLKESAGLDGGKEEAKRVPTAA